MLCNTHSSRAENKHVNKSKLLAVRALFAAGAGVFVWWNAAETIKCLYTQSGCSQVEEIPVRGDGNRTANVLITPRINYPSVVQGAY